jgi:hypothetical protein
MKKTTKKRLDRKLHKVTGHKYVKKAGISILGVLALFYLLYQIFNIVGLFKPI